MSKVVYTLIVPHFNDEVGLERLLATIPKRNDIQVIVVDDRSESNIFKDVVGNCGLQNIQLFVNDGIKSAGSCRNIGLAKATGDYLLFADADDFFVGNAFDILDSAIFQNPESDVIFFNVTSLGEDGQIGFRHEKNRALVLEYKSLGDIRSEQKLRFCHNVPWGKLIKRRMVVENDIWFDQTIIANDGVFSLKVGKAAKCISANENVVYCVTQSPSSLTRIKDVDKYRVRLEVYVRYYFLLSEEERKRINASPLPLLYHARRYGLHEFFRTVCFFRKNKISLIKNFRLDKAKIKALFG